MIDLIMIWVLRILLTVFIAILLAEFNTCRKQEPKDPITYLLAFIYCASLILYTIAFFMTFDIYLI